MDQELKHEQVFVDRVYERLEAAASAAKLLAADGHARARLGNEGGLVERDAIVFHANRRLAALDLAHEGLVFGRLDLGDRQARYIGRLGLRDADREVLLVDWRAPAASVFYQATAQDPLGVVRRRVIHGVGAKVVDIEDDLLDADNAPDDMVIVGEGALMAALSRSRDRFMHSVVATIQKEQDEAIRSPHRGVTSITGGPGTGKTVVALHRVAYLLYTERQRYQRGGVLVVGPNAVFMSYIERVLPSLGETSVSLRALGEVVDGLAASRHDSASVAEIKGSGRMRGLLARTARGPVPGGPTAFRVFYRDDVLTLDGPLLDQVSRRLLVSAGHRRNRAVPHVVEELLETLWQQVRGDRALSRGRGDFEDTLSRSSEFNEFVQGWWPAVDAIDVLGWLSDRDRLAADAGGLLTPREIDDLVESWGSEDLTVEDVPLLDELRYLIGEVPQRAPVADPLDDLHDETVPELSTGDQRWGGEILDRRWAQRPTGSIDDDVFAHVLLDEAQDLSPMQWRMLGRRGRHASWTIVGDPAQSSWPLPQEAATARAEALASRELNSFRLSKNYRNSAEIFDLAVDFARRRIPDVDIPEAVRRTGFDPEVLEVSAAALGAAVRSAVAELSDAVDGTLAVVVPDGWRAPVGEWVDGSLEERVSVLEALDTKGLEFDALVVVEPDLILDRSSVGTHTLYVVLTRATQRLRVIGSSHRWRHDG
ncbi:MAG: HelD family protein [Nocardioidaceae bacterium]